MGKALINGINVHYQVKGEGPDVVLIHGITSTLALWYTHVMPVLTREFRVTMYDLRGHGYSDLTPTGYTSDAMGRDLLGLMDHLGIPTARLVGHSFGGSIALHAALHEEGRAEGIVISDSGVASLRHLRNIEDWPGWDMWTEQLAEHGISRDKFSDDPDKIIRRSFLIPRQFGMRKGEQRGTKRLQRLVDETSVVKEFREVAGLTEEMLPRVTVPVLALYGAMSPYRKMAARLCELLPHGYWEVLEGTGHFLLLQNPEQFVDSIAEFLRDPSGYVTERKKSQSDAGSQARSIQGA